MKTSIKSAVMAAAALFCILSCGNAGAQNNKKKSSAPGQQYAIELTSETFNEKVYDMTKEGGNYLGSKPAIVDFTATWCGPCQRIAPILNELALEYKNKIVIYKVDVDKNADLAKAFNISSIPALLFIPMEGEPVMLVGARDKARFKQDIDKILLKK